MGRYGFGNRIVRVLLESGLHAQMPFRGHIVGGHKHLADIFGNLFKIMDAPLPGDGIHQLRRVKPFFPGNAFKIGIDLHQFVVVHDIPDKAQGEQRLDAAGTV